MITRRSNGHVHCGLMSARARQGGSLLLRALRKGIQDCALRVCYGRADWAWIFGFPDPLTTEGGAGTWAHMA
eukprot:6487505-Amphidinium_carterae.1